MSFPPTVKAFLVVKTIRGCAIGNPLVIAPLGQSLLTFGPEFHMYTCMHAFATLTASHHMIKVHDVTAKHCELYQSISVTPE